MRRNDEPSISKWSPELKFVDTVNSTAPSAAGTWYLFNMPAQGVAQNQRIGDRARIRDVMVNMVLFSSGAADLARVLIIQEKGLSAATPTTAAILQTARPDSPLTYNATELYEVLYDEMIPTAQNSSLAVTERRLHLTPKIPDLRFQAGSTTLYSGQIYALAITYANLTTTIVINDRIWFEDTN